MSMLIGDSSRQLQIIPCLLRVANLLPPTHDHQPSLARLPPVKKRSVEYKASVLVSAECRSVLCSSVLPSMHACMSALQTFSTVYYLMWEWGESKSFDVATGYTQTVPSCHPLKFAWGEHYSQCTYMYITWMLPSFKAFYDVIYSSRYT